MSTYSSDVADQLGNIDMLGEAEEFLESFNWTNDSLRGLESVNRNRVHTISCGSVVCSNMYRYM